MATNKVEFGLSNLYVGTYTDNNGTITMGSPFHQIGAVSLNLESESEENTFHADNKPFWSGYSDNGFTGTIEVARFDNDFKTEFLGYIQLDDGGIASVKNANKPKCYFCFEGSGDAEGRRVIVYDVAFGSITREFSTIEDSIEPVTESIDFTATGDNTTGITVVSYAETDAGYEDLFTNPPAPQLPASV